MPKLLVHRVSFFFGGGGGGAFAPLENVLPPFRDFNPDLPKRRTVAYYSMPCMLEMEAQQTRQLLSNPIYAKSMQMALPVPTKTFLPHSPDTVMLFAPSGCTHPPPPVPPFLLSQNLSPKDIAGSHRMKLKVL